MVDLKVRKRPEMVFAMWMERIQAAESIEPLSSCDASE